MTAEKISIHADNIEKRKKLFKKRFPKESKYFFEFLRLASIGKINKGKQIGVACLRKYLDMITIFLSFVSKPLEKLTEKDMQNFINDLQKDKIISVRFNKPYSETTKQLIKINLRIYLKWRLPSKYTELTDWFDTKVKNKTPITLSEAEVERLYENAGNIENRFLIAVLFDSGLRAEEFHNIRFGDIEEPNENCPYYKITIRTEYSKTEGRTIGMFWKHSTKAIKDYLKEYSGNQTEVVWSKEYANTRKWLYRFGKKVLRKRVHYHLFRKSSATYYADKLNRQQLCIRYGWKFSSDIPDIYIKRSGVLENEIQDKILNTSMNKLERHNQELETKYNLLKSELDKVHEFTKLLSKQPKFKEFAKGVLKQNEKN